MSWGGRWQKGLSHQACVASDSEQGKDQTAQGSGRSLQLPASRASLGLPGLPGPGLTAGEATAPLCSPRPIPCRELPRSWGGRRRGCSQVLTQEEASPRLQASDSGDAPRAEGKVRGHRRPPGVRTETGMPEECGHLGLGATSASPASCSFHPCPWLRGSPFPFGSVGKRDCVPLLRISAKSGRRAS